MACSATGCARSDGAVRRLPQSQSCQPHAHAVPARRQSGLLDPIATRVVVPLCKPEVLSGKPAQRLNPAFEIEGRKLYLLTPELAGVPRKALGEPVGNLSAERHAIIDALDLVFTGI